MKVLLVSSLLPALVASTGAPSARHDASTAHLLSMIASSRPAHVPTPASGDPQDDFDCAWRALAYEYGPTLQPWLNATQRRQLFDALELATLCGAWTISSCAFVLCFVRRCGGQCGHPSLE